MVETVSAQPPALGQAASVSAVRLEPGTELKARVEANLPGGVVRLATDDAKFDLKLPVRLPPGSDVIVSVSGNRANPVIQVTTPQVLPGEPAPPIAAQQPQQTAAQSQPLPGRSAPGQATVPQAVSGAALPEVTDAERSAPAARAASASRAEPTTSRQPVQGAPAQQGADLKGAAVQQAAGTARQTAPPGASAAQASQAVAREAVLGSRPDPVVAGSRPPSGAPFTATPLAVAAKSGMGVSSNTAAAVQASAAAGSDTVASARVLSSASSQAQATASPVRSSAPVTGNPPAAAQPQANLQLAGNPVGQTPLRTPANPSSASASAVSSQEGEAAAKPSTPAPQANSVGAIKSAASQQIAPKPGILPPVTPGAAATPASASTGAAPATALTPQGRSAAVSAPVASQPVVPGQAAIGSPLPGPEKPSPIPAAVASPGPSAAKPGAVAADVPQPSVRAAANTATSAPGVPVAASPQPKAKPPAGESLRLAQHQPYQSSASGTVHRTADLANTGAATGTRPASQPARQAFQALGEQQSGLGTLFAQVGNLMAAQGSAKVSLPDPVVRAMQQILGLRLNPAQSLSAGDIQQSIRMSGQFREATAAFSHGNTQGAPTDLKSVLMSFRSLLQQLGAEAQVTRPAAQPKPPSRQDAPQAQAQQGGRGFLPGTTPQILQAMLKETDAALARVRMTQLVNAGLAGDERAQAPSRPMDLVVELPLALGQETGIVQMQVGRDGSGQGEDDGNEPAWRLRFAMDLTATGPVEAAVSLRGGGTYVSLWVERSTTFDSLKALEETMMASFADAGLDLQEFRLVRGLPPKAVARYGALVDRQS